MALQAMLRLARHHLPDSRGQAGRGQRCARDRLRPHAEAYVTVDYTLQVGTIECVELPPEL
jgi:hypothetical protein